MQVSATLLTRGRATGSNAGYELVEDDVFEYYGDSFVVCTCIKCASPFLLLEVRYSVDPEANNITKHKVLYPIEGNVSFASVPQKILKPYLQAVRNYEMAQYEPCVIMCRRAVEVLAKDKNISGSNLYERLVTMHSQGIVDKKMLEWAHSIRLVGNEAAHDDEGNIPVNDASDILEFTEALLYYIYEVNKKYTDFKKRREKS